MTTVSKEFFDHLYQQNSDPWNFATNTYELTRYKRIFSLLSHQFYQRILEVGCSIGILTRMLSSIACRIDALDISAVALGLAARNCADLTNINFICESIQNYQPRTDTDLIILSEVGYYFTKNQLAKILCKLTSHCHKPLTLLACHWLGYSADHILPGDEVHSLIALQEGVKLISSHKNLNYRLDKWVIETC